jgi:hypothetical protein
VKDEMKRPIFALVLGALFLALGFPLEAQQAGKVYRIGFLLTTTADANLPRAIKERLQELGRISSLNRATRPRSFSNTKSTLS